MSSESKLQMAGFLTGASEAGGGKKEGARERRKRKGVLRSCYRYGAPSRTTIRILPFGTTAWRENNATWCCPPKEDDRRWQKLYRLWNQPRRKYTKIVESIGLHPQIPFLLWPSLLVHIASPFISHPFFFTASLPQISFCLWPSLLVYFAW